ncbi:hypothetical protein Tco_0026626 [Tanacetum coccineum]
MTAPVISISSDSSKESVGSHVPRVILFGTIPTSIFVVPVVPVELPIAPADPLVAPEDSLPVAPELPLVLPFLCFDDSEADSESKPAKGVLGGGYGGRLLLVWCYGFVMLVDVDVWVLVLAGYGMFVCSLMEDVVLCTVLSGISVWVVNWFRYCEIAAA